VESLSGCFYAPALAGALLSLHAHAADSQAPETELPTLTVIAQAAGDDDNGFGADRTSAATKLALAPRDTPQSVTVITRERMDDQNMQNLRDVLDNTTGIYSFGYDTERTVFMARGFVLDNTLIDGVPTLTRSNTDSTDASLDTALYDRIEVVRGATGLLTGAGNPSAALNLVRKRADSHEFAGSIEASVGSWNDYRTMADVQSPLNSSGSIRGRVVGVYQQNESYMDFYESAKNVLYATLDMDLTPDTTLTLGYDYQKTTPNGVTWGWFPLYFSDGSRADWSRSFSTATNWSYWDNTTETAFAELRHNLGHDWSLRTSLSHRETFSDTSLFFMDYYDYGAGSNFPDRGTGVGPTPYAGRYRDTGRQNAVDVYASGPFQLMDRQ
ncbi:MAG: TonB-dependent receptor plug domain-containing protein, partial [Perlucidibaca sp.]